MKSTMGVCLVVLSITCTVLAQQDSSRPVLRSGKSVKMAVSNQATEMRMADDENATVVTVTEEGNLFVGMQPVQSSGLGELKAETVYVKADARVPYQKILTVLDSLRGHSVVLLTASPSNPERTDLVPPYGVKVILNGQ
ncbi:MAG TPA: hypothetical protein VG498_18555 [Terriglobales bacterium]|nr:hypothetical protein [Terriglobales bacterium]